MVTKQGMAATEPAGKAAPCAPAPRHIYGPRALAALLPAVTRAAYRRRSPAGAQVLADWDAIVGPALGALTAPRKLVAGTLTVACSGPVAMELAHLSDALVDRINAHVGHALVARLRLVQDHMAPSSAPAAPAPPRPEVLAAADRAVADLPPGALRDALAALGRAVLGRAVLAHSTPPDSPR